MLGFKFQLPQLKSYAELTGGGGTRNVKNLVKRLGTVEPSLSETR